MRRIAIAPRKHWQSKVESKGLTYHTLPDGSAYWDESAYWEFTAAEIDRLERATAEIQRVALLAGDFILQNNRLASMGIPETAAARIRETWNQEPPALYGRLDLAFDGYRLKLMEYNADTPTALVEASVTQWYWLEELFPTADQFNSLHEKLVAKWRDLLPYLAQPVYFTHDGSEEDRMTISYLRDAAEQAGHRTVAMAMREIGWEDAKSRFVDLGREPMRSIFKLYPWEWLLRDSFGDHALATMNCAPKSAIAKIHWIEPVWKMLWSNKALLAILWEMFPGHENLLPAYIGSPRDLRNYVRKPRLGREGAGITVYRDGVAVEGCDAQGDDTGFVFQQTASLASAGGFTAVFGSWLIDGEPAGMGVRESRGLITDNTSRFVPHLFR